jgi:hypothetical protein
MGLDVISSKTDGRGSSIPIEVDVSRPEPGKGDTERVCRAASASVFDLRGARLPSRVSSGGGACWTGGKYSSTTDGTTEGLVIGRTPSTGISREEVSVGIGLATFLVAMGVETWSGGGRFGCVRLEGEEPADAIEVDAAGGVCIKNNE